MDYRDGSVAFLLPKFPHPCQAAAIKERLKRVINSKIISLAICLVLCYNFFWSGRICLSKDGFPSGQRGQTVNLLQFASVVRIHLHPFPKRIPEKGISEGISPKGVLCAATHAKYASAGVAE